MKVISLVSGIDGIEGPDEELLPGYNYFPKRALQTVSARHLV